MPVKILILGGTVEAREIAKLIVACGHNVTSSLAGVTSRPHMPVGKTRIGGFGGVAGLRDYLSVENVDVVVDATHPFAAQMSAHASAAVADTPTLLLRFERPAWQPTVRDDWHEVKSIQAAADYLPSETHAFVTTGRQELQPFFGRNDISGVARTVERPLGSVPNSWRLILERPPQSLESELTLFKQEMFTHLVSKNAGGVATQAKLEAASILNLPVVMVQRPKKPQCETFSDIQALIKRLGT